jgi:asparagine synthase (glutamine-hydrolysing)
LYWGIFDRTLLFASEPKVLLAHPSVRPDLNINALRQYLSFDYVPAPLQFMKATNKLPAAHNLTLEDGRVEVRPYWRLSYQTHQPVPSVAEAAERLRDLIEDSVRNAPGLRCPARYSAVRRYRLFAGDGDGRAHLAGNG